ncbi:N-acetylglucosaminyl-diphospho-decaprenol L-rhamnosyltransferase [Calidithermus terrae]|uniref:N-acetylglucosaminyl-diphospho-decaprenol L-rhamnosyltransferase n=1 Tax=Calidithermus terrae TaxID=1408545 RepID=A0A399EPD4_9DEIN|nr:glycosyltransferase family 2 protein [Calidithermus terrae]RIH84001.1 N-acetylglucosaminyl-diphospho-decaprenol L-rhamnosyltransferase [Calidithermus terrae]
MELSVVVISHNSLRVLPECLERLQRHYPHAQLIVVDAASSDGSLEFARQFPGVKALSVANRGYAYAVNRGLEAATGRRVAVMNSDVYLEAGDLEALGAALDDHPKAVMAGPVLVTPHGRPQSFGPLYVPYYLNLRAPRAVSWISGALILLKRELLLELGGMDERLFFYNEDLEWGIRARRKGFGVLLVPRRVLHLGGASTPNDPRFIAEGYRGGLIVSQTHYPWLHGLHRKAVWLEAQLRVLLDPNPKHKTAYSLLLSRLGQQKDLPPSFLLEESSKIHP